MLVLQCACGETYFAQESNVGRGIRCRACGRFIPRAKATKFGAAPEVYHLRRPQRLRKLGLAAAVALAVLILVLKPDQFIPRPLPEPKDPAPPQIPFVRQLPVEPVIVSQPPQVALAPLEVELKPVLAEPKPILVEPKPVEPAEPPVSLGLGESPFGPGIHSGRSTLTVENGTDTDALVKLVSLNGGERLVRNFFVPAGRDFKATAIPPGSYVLRVAFGIDWDRGARRFRRRRSFSQTERFNISETRTATGIMFENMRITLHRVVNGNFHSDEIDEAAFSR